MLFHIEKIANEELQFEFSSTIKCNNSITDAKPYEKECEKQREVK